MSYRPQAGVHQKLIGLPLQSYFPPIHIQEDPAFVFRFNRWGSFVGLERKEEYSLIDKWIHRIIIPVVHYEEHDPQSLHSHILSDAEVTEYMQYVQLIQAGKLRLGNIAPVPVDDEYDDERNSLSQSQVVVNDSDDDQPHSDQTATDQHAPPPSTENLRDSLSFA